jgi:recombination protein RecA
MKNIELMLVSDEKFVIYCQYAGARKTRILASPEDNNAIIRVTKEGNMAKKTTKSESSSSADESGKKQALDLAIAQITKQFGDGSIMKLGESQKIDVELLPSGSLSLDMALGGGYPKGRIIEIYGPESSGKTTLALHAIAEIQKQGGQAAFIDAEHALDPAYAKKIGVDTDNLFISQPDNGEQALEITETLVRSGAVDLIVVDSVAALVPQAEIDGDMGDAQMGLQARLMSQAMRKLTGIISKSKATVIFINQIRMKIGVMFGNPETTTGGNALKFYASVRMDIRRIGQIKDGDNIAGSRTKVKIVKNKIAAPFRTAEFDIMYNEGISKCGDVLDLAVQKGIIDKAGAFLKYNGETIAQGREAAKKLFKENPELMEEIDQKVRVAAGLVDGETEAIEAPEEMISEE